jgi:hypothetical protein
MAKLLLGREVADALAADLTFRVEQLQRSGVDPALTIIRLGEKAGDMSYEKGARNRAAQLGVRVNTLALPETTTVEELMDTIDRLNDDAKVHGVLLLRPLPEHMRDRKQEIFNHLVPEKDVDGMTDISAAGVYTGQGQGFPPCTPAACMEMLDHYGVVLKGRKVTIFGRRNTCDDFDGFDVFHSNVSCVFSTHRPERGIVTKSHSINFDCRSECSISCRGSTLAQGEGISGCKIGIHCLSTWKKSRDVCRICNLEIVESIAPKTVRCIQIIRALCCNHNFIQCKRTFMKHNLHIPHTTCGMRI